MAALWSAFAGFLLSLFKAFINKPNSAVVEGEELGAAQTQATVAEASNAEIEKASSSGTAVSNAVAGDDGLRKYEATDPNNRDND